SPWRWRLPPSASKGRRRSPGGMRWPRAIRSSTATWDACVTADDASVGQVVAIDGPAGSGKSTVAQAVARKPGLAYLDTGAMYRSVTHVALGRGVDVDDGDALARLARDLEIEVGDRVVVDGVDVSEAIRAPAVNRA